jgi:hypothetical protein
MLDEVYSSGVTFWDTADLYGVSKFQRSARRHEAKTDLLAILIRSSRAVSIAETHRAIAKGADGVLVDLAGGKRHG